jgi:hypothetical protein
MKGRYTVPKWPGYPKTIHYEITGAGRIDYQFNSSATEGARGGPNGVVKILTIDLGSHCWPANSAAIKAGIYAGLSAAW